jgi:Polyketide cyclase / dehydrase and lipid transport
MKPVDVTTAIDIARPREAVAGYAADPDHAPDWYANIDRVIWETEKPLTIGTRLGFVARFLGRTLSYSYEVTEFVADELLIMATTEGPFAMETTYSWSDLPGQWTHMTLRNRGTPHGFAGLTAPLMTAAMQRANRKDLVALKTLLEGLR